MQFTHKRGHENYSMKRTQTVDLATDQIKQSMIRHPTRALS